MNYYNDNDPYVCDWLENLILFCAIPNGIVDCRPIQEVTPSDVKGFRQCHFFAGIGGWSLALKLARWPEDLRVWTGSCPCQPFSVAGKQKGFADERDLWPSWFRLQKKCRPPVIFGEQVANASQWLSRVRSDLCGMGYSMGESLLKPRARVRRSTGIVFGLWPSAKTPSGGQKNPKGTTLAGRTPKRKESNSDASECSINLLADSQPLVLPPSHGWGQGWTKSEFRSRGFTASVASLPDGSQFIECPDGKYRRLPPPRVRWLGNGLSSRVARLRALGNSIYPPVAAQFIRSYMDVRGL